MNMTKTELAKAVRANVELKNMTADAFTEAESLLEEAFAYADDVAFLE